MVEPAQPSARLGPDDITAMAAFLRARWADERANAAAHDGTYNDADACWGIHADPAGVIADLDAKEALLTDILAEPHTVCEDLWYTCCAATEERDGSTCPRSDHQHLSDACNCGLTDRTVRRLQMIALPYAARPDYQERWRP